MIEVSKCNKLVSMIFPIYNINHEFFIKCIDSALNQSYKNIEIILVDDGSTNNIEEICMEYTKKYDRVKYIKQENSGVSIARNNGFNNSNGDYICFVDPDDWMESNYVEELLKVILEKDVDFSICSCKVNYSNHIVSNNFLNVKENEVCVLKGTEKNRLLYQLIGKKICDYYPPEVAVGVPWAKMFKKSFIEKNGLEFVPKMARMQDNIFCLYAFEMADSIAYIEKKLYNYRKEQGSACYKYSPKIFDFFEKYFDESFKFLNKFSKEEILFTALYMKELTSYNSFLSQNIFHKENKKSYKEKINDLNEKLNEKRYVEALKKIDYRYLNFTEKIFVFSLKHRFFILLNILIKIRNLKKM